MKYSDKLKDPRWQRRRLEIMQRDEFTCQCCGDDKSTLNVHHKQYHGNPWDAPRDSLETLCEDCHKDRADINKRFLSLDTGLALALGQFMTEDVDPSDLNGTLPALMLILERRVDVRFFLLLSEKLKAVK